jgi:hypothetical protein
VSVLVLRRRLPLIVFILLALVCLVMIGLACACFTDHRGKALEHATVAVPTGLAPGYAWPWLTLILLATTALVTRAHGPRSRSAADLQRFLF